MKNHCESCGAEFPKGKKKNYIQEAIIALLLVIALYGIMYGTFALLLVIKGM